MIVLMIWFTKGQGKEWRNISLLIKSHENFESYSLSVFYNILKAHEDDVKESVDEKEKDKATFGGPLDFL